MAGARAAPATADGGEIATAGGEERVRLARARPWVALVGPEVEENLALRYLAAALSAGGFEPEILAFNASEDLPLLLADICTVDPPPLFVGVSLSFQRRALDALALIVGLRERGFRGHVTAGGHFGAFAHAELLADFPELDSVCCYEAEATVVELGRALAAGRRLDGIAALAQRDADGRVRVTPPGPPAELGTLAWPDRRGEPTSCLGHGVVPIVGSRGCYASCSFCCIAAWHRRARGGKRFRSRPVADLADEMASLHHDRGVDIFVFHDDNFFLPRHEDSLARIHALADALAARRVGRIGTVVKARPNDVTREILQAMRDRLGCIRVFLGIENDSAQGQSTLNRQLSQEEHARALEVASELGIYVCFNMLIFDPDTTLASLEENLAFMLRHAESPWNFGRVELYAGTPLLARLQAEGACRGNYLGWDYRIADPAAQRVFELGMPAFIKRNFAPGALANRLGGTRFDVEVARHFHPERFRPAWLERSRELSRALGTDTVATLREVVAHVAACGPEAEAGPLAEELPARLRRVERELRARASALEREVQETIGACCRHVKLPTRLAPSLR